MSSRYLISIRNIPWTISHFELYKYFSAFGSIKIAKVLFNKHGISTGHGFVEFYDAKAMSDVLCRDHLLEQEQLIIASGFKYLQEEGIKDLVENYMPSESTQSSVGEYAQNNIPVSEEQNFVKLNKYINYRNNLFDGNEPSIMKELLRIKNTSR